VLKYGDITARSLAGMNEILTALNKITTQSGHNP
jgi:hypothetical protein